MIFVLNAFFLIFTSYDESKLYLDAITTLALVSTCMT